MPCRVRQDEPRPVPSLTRPHNLNGERMDMKTGAKLFKQDVGQPLSKYLSKL
jgi:hypothetical protein